MILACSADCVSAVERKFIAPRERAMRGLYFDHILTSMTLALMLAAPLGAFGQDSSEPAATFNERFPADQTSTRPPLATPGAKKEQNVTMTTLIVSANRPRSLLRPLSRPLLS